MATRCMLGIVAAGETVDVEFSFNAAFRMP